MFQLILLVFTVVLCNGQTTFVCPDRGSNYLPVSLPTKWINGSLNCFAKNAQHPGLEVYSMNNDTYIIRENKCINYEAPFIYLLFGRKIVLLIDSGATTSANLIPIRDTVETLIRQWCETHSIFREDLTLVVAHSHNHRDHTAGDDQFRGKPFTTIVGTSVAEVSAFFHISDWPNSIASYGLDESRSLAVIPIPGHENSSIAIYDCATGLLFTGDSLLPGRLYIANFSANVDSISRLSSFVQSNHLNVSFILGAHIEMSEQNQIEYPTGSTYQPHERSLNLSLIELHQLDSELQQQWHDGFNARHRAYYNTFIVDPNPSELPLLPPDQRVASHGFIVMPLDKLGSVWISHKPTFSMPHDFQLVFHAFVTDSTIDPLPFPTNVSQLNNQWTLEPDRWSLNNLINGNFTSFRARLYLGNFEQSGQYLGNVTIHIIQPLLEVVQLNMSAVIPYQPIRYFSYLLTNRTMVRNGEIHFYLLHQIRVQPDFDSIAHVTIDPKTCISDLDQDRLIDLLLQDGNEWAFPGLDNEVATRLTGGSGKVRGELLGDIYSTVCTMKVIEEIQCTLGPDFYEDCNV